MHYRIRPATVDDLPVVHKYMCDIFALRLNGLSLRPHGFSAEDASHYLPSGRDSREKLCALAIAEDRIAGQLAFSRYPKPEYRHGGSFGMSVHPQYWRKGIATALLRYLEEWAVAAAIEKLELAVWANNENAIALYEKNGYQHEGCRRGTIITHGRKTDLILMGKSLFAV